MIHFATATQPAPARNTWSVALGYIVAFGATGMAVAQMVSFEDFVEALRSYHLTGSRGTLALAISLLVIEIFSVPVLFRLALSPAARAVGTAFVLLAPLVWTALTVMALMGGAQVVNAGYAGGFVKLGVGGLVLMLDIVWAAAASVYARGLIADTRKWLSNM